MTNSEVLEIISQLKKEAACIAFIWLSTNVYGIYAYRKYKKIAPLIGTFILSLPILLVSTYVWLHPTQVIQDELTGFPGNYMEFKHKVYFCMYLFAFVFLASFIMLVINRDPKAPYPKNALISIIQNKKDNLTH